MGWLKVCFAAFLLIPLLPRTQDIAPLNPRAHVTADAPLAWRGLKPGIIRGGAINTLSTFPDKPILIGCEPSKVRGADTCTWMTTDKFTMSFMDGKLIAIMLIVDHKRFLPLVTALKDKFGFDPLETSHQYSNTFGRVLVGTTYTWRRGGTTLKVDEYSGDIEHSSMFLTDDALWNEYSRRAFNAEKPDV